MTLPNDAHIGQVSLTVSDLDRSLAFYTGVLGFAS
jgi:catechol 2,3-dioxygenase-like lactoylglutathione lyase family enzyme